MSDDFDTLVPDIQRMAGLMPQMVVLMPPMIASMKEQKQIMLSQYQVQKAQQDQTMAMQANASAMGQAFDDAKNDDSFYLPPEAFETADFKSGIKLFVSPNGHAVRFTIFHQSDPLTEEGTSRVEPLKTAAEDAIKAHRSRARRSTSAAAPLCTRICKKVPTTICLSPRSPR